MRIKRICYPVKVLGPGKRAGIWVTGCSFGCKGCMSPELQSKTAGNEMSCEKIISALHKIKGPVEGFTLSGGEPFDQAEELSALVSLLKEEFNDDIIIYTGYTLEELQERNCSFTDSVLDTAAVIIDGRYVDSLNDGKGLRGSSNQRIHIFRNKEKYEYMKSSKRELQVFNYLDSSNLIVGLLD